MSLGPRTRCSGASQSHPALGQGECRLVLKRAAFGLTVKRCQAAAPAAQSVADCVYKFPSQLGFLIIIIIIIKKQSKKFPLALNLIGCWRHQILLGAAPSVALAVLPPQRSLGARGDPGRCGGPAGGGAALVSSPGTPRSCWFWPACR